jgi:hypothetical protein
MINGCKCLPTENRMARLATLVVGQHEPRADRLLLTGMNRRVSGEDYPLRRPISWSRWTASLREEAPSLR